MEKKSDAMRLIRFHGMRLLGRNMRTRFRVFHRIFLITAHPSQAFTSKIMTAVSRRGRRNISSRFNCLGIIATIAAASGTRDWNTYSRPMQFSIALIAGWMHDGYQVATNSTTKTVSAFTKKRRQFFFETGFK